MSKKYSNEDLKNAVALNFSVMGVMRTLNIKMAGGSHTHISNRIKKENLDTSHFLGQRGNIGKPPKNKQTAQEILIFNPDLERRQPAKKLIRSMRYFEVKYSCIKCNCDGVWNNKPLTLHVDHMDGNWKNNRLENLRFLCPNCHSQTSTFGRRKQIIAGVA